MLMKSHILDARDTLMWSVKTDNEL